MNTLLEHVNKENGRPFSSSFGRLCAANFLILAVLSFGSCGSGDTSLKITSKLSLDLLAYEDIGSFVEGMAYVMDSEEMYGFINDKGKLAVPCIYRDAYDFKDGLALVLTQNDRWGFIDKSGKEVIPCVYEDCSDFISSLGLAKVKKNGKWGFIDKTGVQVTPCIYDQIGNHFENGMMEAVRDGKHGFVDSLGKEAIPCKWDDVWGFEDGLAIIALSRFRGLIDSLGNMIVSPYGCYDEVHYDKDNGVAVVKQNGKWGLVVPPAVNVHSYYMYDNYIRFDINNCKFAKVERDGKWGFLDKRSNEVVPCVYDDVGSFIGDGMVKVFRGNKCGFVDIETGMETIQCIYDYPDEFSEGLAYVGFGHYIDKSGNVAILGSFEYGMGFSGGLAAVVKDSKWGYIDKTGKEVIPFMYREAMPFWAGKAAVKQGHLWGFIDKTGKEVVPPTYNDLFFWGDGYSVKFNGKYGYLDSLGNEAVPCIYDDIVFLSESYKGVAQVSRNGKIGYVNESGKEVIPCAYDRIDGYFNGDGLVKVSESGWNWGIIDTLGNTIIPLCYEEIVLVEDQEFYAAKRDGKWGIVDRAGQEVILCKYDNQFRFVDGYAQVQIDGMWGIIDSKGKEIVPCDYEYVDLPFSSGVILALMELKDGTEIWGYVDKKGNSTLLTAIKQIEKIEQRKQESEKVSKYSTLQLIQRATDEEELRCLLDGTVWTYTGNLSSYSDKFGYWVRVQFDGETVSQSWAFPSDGKWGGAKTDTYMITKGYYSDTGEKYIAIKWNGPGSYGFPCEYSLVPREMQLYARSALPSLEPSNYGKKESFKSVRISFGDFHWDQ